MMQLLLKRLGDEDPQTKSNAAYAIGRLVEKSEDNRDGHQGLSSDLVQS